MENYQKIKFKEFRQAVASFKADLPSILNTLKNIINTKISHVYLEENQEFQQKFNDLLQLCQNSLNSNVSSDDIREMIIQHILTEDILINIFQSTQFYQQNNIAKSLHQITQTFFTDTLKKDIFQKIDNYYSIIIKFVPSLTDLNEKQKFLNEIYEEFYQSYNHLIADRLGIVYTPNEIGNFMIESTDYLLHKHFNKLLGDRHVEILDPATGTGTFITALMNYLPQHELRDKYLHEIHCNEVSILPYYIANLNIEYTYQQLIKEYEVFENICLVDTLDNTSFENKQMDLFSMTMENTERIKRQNERKISVIIGNPPYNANQQNENDNNKNREYPAIDKRIKDTYIKESTAQKTKVYDMYARFIRWASDRITNKGIIAFVTNSSFINAKTFDGFRKVVKSEFDYIYILDLGGNIRGGDTTGNVFNIMVGVAIVFFVKKTSQNKLPCQIFYHSLTNLNNSQEKLRFLVSHKFEQINFQHLQPDEQNNWINLTNNDFYSLLPLANKETKLAKNNSEEKAVFKLYSLGLATNRDEWVYDFDKQNLANKVKFFCEFYQQEQKRWFSSQQQIKINNFVDRQIKWTSELEQHLIKGSSLKFVPEMIIKSLYRPFIEKYIYFNRIIVHRLYQQDYFFPLGQNQENIIIAISGNSSSKSFQCLATKTIIGLDFLEKTQCLSLYRYENNQKIENITDWGLQKFRDNYHNNNISKLHIFHYIYAVLHNPQYRHQYEINLKRDFPRIPFYNNFYQWVKWGKELMELHLNYENITPYPLQVKNQQLKGKSVRVKLKSDQNRNQIIIDEMTTLENIPNLAWEYQLGNRSALEWILDQYKEKKIKDKTVNNNFNNYHFTDYKEEVITLLMKVTTVSIETMKIIQEINSYSKMP
jgi:predicted helicase